MAKPPYRGPWQKIRLTILERDQGVCQIRREGCTTIATHVDHIIPLSHGGPPHDPTNLRAACEHCNVGRSNGRTVTYSNPRW